MNKILKFSFLLVLFSLCFAIADVDAQNYGRKKKKKKKSSKPKTEKTDDYFDESGNFASKLWYGGALDLSYCSPTFNLSLFGGGICTPYVSSFTGGITPMVGYKIVGGLSAGPTAGIRYNTIKGTAVDNTIRHGDAMSWSLGVFARYKFLRTLFAHTEYGIESNEYVYFDNIGRILVHPVTLDVITERINQSKFYLGIGYNSGGELLAFEIYLLNNFIKPPYETTDILNLTLRFGLTYKF